MQRRRTPPPYPVTRTGWLRAHASAGWDYCHATPEHRRGSIPLLRSQGQTIQLIDALSDAHRKFRAGCDDLRGW